MPVETLEKPKWRLSQTAFLAPNKLKEGTIFYYSGEPGPHFEPLNEAAALKMQEYIRTHPEAMMGRPVDSLPMTMEEAEIISVPSDRSSERALTIEEMADGKASKPVRTVFDAMERLLDNTSEEIKPIEADKEYVPSAAQLSEADKKALAEVEAGARAAAEAKAKAAEAKQPKGATAE